VEQCEADRDMHKLSSRCFGSLNFYLFFLPVALILTLCSILSYVASAESNREVFNADVGAGVGCLCGFCVFSIAIQEILGLSTLAMFHKTAEKELIDLVDELEFSSVRGRHYVYPYDSFDALVSFSPSSSHPEMTVSWYFFQIHEML